MIITVPKKIISIPSMGNVVVPDTIETTWTVIEERESEFDIEILEDQSH